jgi:hypothetical protein
VVATRVARLTLGNGDATFLDLAPSATQVASLTRRYAWLANVPGYATGNGIVSGLPELDLEAGWTLASTTDAIDVGDAWSAISVLVVDTWVRHGPDEIADEIDVTVLG